MGNTTNAFIFVMTINILCFIFQVSVIGLNEQYDVRDSNTINYHCGGSILEAFSDNCTSYETVTVNNNDLTQQLPGTAQTTTVSSGFTLTDVFTSIKSWFLNTTGLKYLYAIVTGPANVIKIMELPNEFAWALTSLWYGINLLIIIAFLWWRD